MDQARHRQHRILGVTPSVLLLVASRHFRPATACGGFFCEPLRPILQAGERIVFEVDNGNDVNDITMTVQIDYEGPSEQFGWVLPVPVQPQLSVGSDILFAQLHTETSPVFEFDIDVSQSKTCTQEDFATCAAAPGEDLDFAEDGGGSERAPDVIVLDSGSVGPFDFEIIQLAEEGDPGIIFDWLVDNGYDQPDEARPLVNYYAEMNMVFVGLKLQSDKQSGEIQPIILHYSMPSGGPIACVPLQITGIAATNNMPIEVWILGPSRAMPLNYFHITMDDRTAVDWVNCVSQLSPQDCYWQSFRQSVASVVDSAAAAVPAFEGHIFVTEFAGPTVTLAGQIAIQIDAEVLKQQTTPSLYMQKLREYGVPDARVVQTTLSKYIPTTLSPNAPFGCSQVTDLYSTDRGTLTDNCLTFIEYDVFDATGLTDELVSVVAQASIEAEKTVQKYAYLTRMYGQQDPSQMTKDPFFTFVPDLPDVSRLHKAVGIPECSESGRGVTSMTIRVGDHPDHSVPASNTCGFWSGSSDVGTISPALELVVAGDGSQGPSILLPQLDGSGQTFFLEAEVNDAVIVMDGRVPNQTLPECSFCEQVDDGNGGGHQGSDDDRRESSASATLFAAWSVLTTVLLHLLSFAASVLYTT